MGFENPEGQKTGLLNEKTIWMQREMYKTTPLRVGTCKELPINN